MSNESDNLEADLNHQLGNTGTIIHEPTERQVVPSGHAPRLDDLQDPQTDALAIVERLGGIASGAWIEAENPVEVER